MLKRKTPTLNWAEDGRYGWTTDYKARLRTIGSIGSDCGKGEELKYPRNNDSLSSSFTFLLALSILSSFITYAFISPDVTFKIFILMGG